MALKRKPARSPLGSAPFCRKGGEGDGQVIGGTGRVDGGDGLA